MLKKTKWKMVYWHENRRVGESIIIIKETENLILFSVWSNFISWTPKMDFFHLWLHIRWNKIWFCTEKNQMSHVMRKPVYAIWAMLWQTNKMICLPSDDSDPPRLFSLPSALNGKLRTKCFFMRTAKTLIRLGRYPGWSESLLNAKFILLVLSWGGLVL